MEISQIIEKLGLPYDEKNVDSKGELWMPCPLPFGNHKHGDQNPSFSINLKSGDCFCFVCGGGSLSWLVQNIKDISFDDARAYVRNLESGNEDKDDFKKRIKSKLDSNNMSQSFEKIPQQIFSEPTISDDFYYHPWVEAQGISKETAMKFNLFYDPERNVVAFPHHWQGKLVGMQFRNLDWGPDSVRKKTIAKYYNTPGFPKKNTLFNYDSQQGDTIILVESPKTCIVMDGRGYPNFVGTFGANTGYEQMAALWKFKRIYLWPDNDDPGKKALREEVKLLKEFVDIYIVPPVDIPKGDAADIPAEEVPLYLERAVPYLKWKLDNEKVHQKRKHRVD